MVGLSDHPLPGHAEQLGEPAVDHQVAAVEVLEEDCRLNVVQHALALRPATTEFFLHALPLTDFFMGDRQPQAALAPSRVAFRSNRRRWPRAESCPLRSTAGSLRPVRCGDAGRSGAGQGAPRAALPLFGRGGVHTPARHLGAYSASSASLRLRTGRRTAGTTIVPRPGDIFVARPEPSGTRLGGVLFTIGMAPTSPS